MLPLLIEPVAVSAKFVAGLHVLTQLPPWQAWLAVQTLVQVPQCAGSFCRLTHCPLQFVVPPEHTRVHTPFWQLCPDAHFLPHVPQWFGFVLVSTQVLLQLVVPPEHTS